MISFTHLYLAHEAGFVCSYFILGIMQVLKGKAIVIFANNLTPYTSETLISTLQTDFGAQGFQLQWSCNVVLEPGVLKL